MLNKTYLGKDALHFEPLGRVHDAPADRLLLNQRGPPGVEYTLTSWYRLGTFDVPACKLF